MQAQHQHQIDRPGAFYLVRCDVLDDGAERIVSSFEVTEAEVCGFLLGQMDDPFGLLGLVLPAGCSEV